MPTPPRLPVPMFQFPGCANFPITNALLNVFADYTICTKQEEFDLIDSYFLEIVFLINDLASGYDVFEQLVDLNLADCMTIDLA